MDLNSLMSMSVIVGIIIGAVAVCKQAGVADRFLPLLSTLFGVLFGFLVVSNDWRMAIIAGLFMGLSACGLYRSVKVTAFGV